VMHNRAIEFAKKFSVPIHVRSSFSDNPGSMITAEPEAADVAVCGAARVKQEARITVLGVPDRPGAALTLFSQVAAKKVAMDLIVQNVAADGRADISFTVFRDDLPAALTAVEEAVRQMGAEGVDYDDSTSKISVVGLGMATQSGVAKTMFRALADRQINIEMITTSEIKISVLVAQEAGQEALRTVHDAFELGVEPATTEVADGGPTLKASASDTAEIVAQMGRMEDLIIEDITLDESQARVTAIGMPNRPGLSARLFEEVAEAGILVDMIVQSTGREGHTNVSFTIPAADVERSVELITRVSGELGCPPPTSCPKVAKLSVFGVGMRSHTSVARRMFGSLAEAGVNVDMINTSEVRVNAVVDGQQGEKALAALKKEFADVMV
ncbi:MAG: ACT domain-containing protein, partial [Actinomycetia bacterium]|nr:ACT domain-containing protein [Actinomycetes bacterium]